MSHNHHRHHHLHHFHFPKGRDWSKEVRSLALGQQLLPGGAKNGTPTAWPQSMFLSTYQQQQDEACHWGSISCTSHDPYLLMTQ